MDGFVDVIHSQKKHKDNVHIIDIQLLRVELNNHWLSDKSAFKGPIFV